MPERLTHTHWIVDEGIRFLQRRDPECPFMLWMVFEAPHSPFYPPEPFDRFYDDFEIPQAVIGDWVGGDDEPVALVSERISRKADRLPPQVVRRLRQHYYGQITHIDYQLGRFFGELKGKGLYDNTVIVITSDHGEHLGDHQLYGKYTYLESSARVPIIMRLPQHHGVYNRCVDTPALTADIVPTLLHLAGLQPDASMDGVSLLDLPADRVIYGETRHSIFATDGRLKFIYYFAGGVEQLFDISNDPDDSHNLAFQPQYAAAKARLRSDLLAYLASNERPAVVDGDLLVTEATLDFDALRARNTAAWRGPLRYGQGYG